MTTTTADITTTPIFPLAPPLPRDAGRKLHPQGIIERRIVWNLIAKLAAAGFTAFAVYDGEEQTECADAMAAMDLIFNLDESSLRVRSSTRDPETAPEHGIYLVGGNGEDIISDWNYSADDADGFNKFMDGFIDTISENF